MPEKIAILGAGSWGCVLGLHLFEKGSRVRLWDLPSQVESIKEKRECLKIPGLVIPPGIEITSRIEMALGGAQIVIVVLPSQAVRGVIRKMKELPLPPIIVSAGKGIENETLMTMSEVILDVLGERPVVVLSGPSHAEEVCRHVPTTIVASSSDEKKTKEIQRIFTTETLRVYTNQDVLGVELGGALKNIIAIAAGISDGLGFGDNTKAALLTRGLAEITRLGVARGAKPLTFVGLSGMGDLITTCTSRYSRNWRLGKAIGQGKSLKEALSDIEMVVEGIPTTKSAHDLAKKFKVEMPITEEVYQVLFQGKDPCQAVTDLMLREAKPEI